MKQDSTTQAIEGKRGWKVFRNDSKTYYITGEDGSRIASLHATYTKDGTDRVKANAKHIVKCVNLFPELEKRCKELEEENASQTVMLEESQMEIDLLQESNNELVEALEDARDYFSV